MTTLVIIDQSPYGSWSGRESLDMAFSLAAFDQPVSILFTGPGVNWLRRAQSADAISQKNVDRNLAAASVFGVEKLMADTASVVRYGLTEAGLLAGVQLVRLESDLITAYSHVVCL